MALTLKRMDCTVLLSNHKFLPWRVNYSGVSGVQQESQYSIREAGTLHSAGRLYDLLTIAVNVGNSHGCVKIIVNTKSLSTSSVFRARDVASRWVHCAKCPHVEIADVSQWRRVSIRHLAHRNTCRSGDQWHNPFACRTHTDIANNTMLTYTRVAAIVTLGRKRGYQCRSTDSLFSHFCSIHGGATKFDHARCVTSLLLTAHVRQSPRRFCLQNWSWPCTKHVIGLLSVVMTRSWRHSVGDDKIAKRQYGGVIDSLENHWHSRCRRWCRHDGDDLNETSKRYIYGGSAKTPKAWDEVRCDRIMRTSAPTSSCHGCSHEWTPCQCTWRTPRCLLSTFSTVHGSAICLD